jgi:hypothetical protein
MSELFQEGSSRDKEVLFVAFGGHAFKFDGIQPFEFLNFLGAHFGQYDRLFYVDTKRRWYHNGIDGLTTNIEDTVSYLQAKIDGYSRVIFIGMSAGGYAAILFGSLLGVNNVIAFVPQTILNHENSLNIRYMDVKPFINAHTTYTIIGDNMGKDLHDISHCRHLEALENVNIMTYDHLNIRELRDTGRLKDIIMSIF